MSYCAIENCDAPVKAKGLCKRHYQQQWRTGGVMRNAGLGRGISTRMAMEALRSAQL